MPVQNGTPVNFGFTGPNGIACAGFSGILQAADHSNAADKDEVRSGQGDIVTRSWFDQHLVATLELVISSTTITLAIAATTVAALAPGTIISITACAADPDLVATTWEVQSGAAIKKSNTTAARLTIPLEKRAGITAVQAP